VQKVCELRVLGTMSIVFRIMQLWTRYVEDIVLHGADEAGRVLRWCICFLSWHCVVMTWTR
jgi:hypothetical protein